MKSEPTIKAGKYKLNFICEVIQRGKNKPQKYKHYLQMNFDLYEELRDNFIIDMEYYYLSECAFIEVDQDKVSINFITLYQCEDLHRKIDQYLITKLLGFYPILRGGFII